MGCEAEDFVIRRGDTLPILVADANDATGGAFDFTGWTIVFKMSGPTDITGPATGSSAGVLSYTWASGDTDIPGRYDAIFVGTSPDGKTQTFPTRGSIPIVIEA